MERNSLFSLMSMTKPFTATAILMLEEEGKISLDDPVSRYVTRFPGDSVTIRHLLMNTSGYPYDHALDEAPLEFASLREWVEVWAAVEPTEPVGAFSYSSFNYGVLGYVVEGVSGRPVERFIEERILSPLGLQDTHTAFSPDSAWAHRTNSRHAWNPEAGAYKREWSSSEEWPFPFFPAGWGMFSTAMDYAQFMAVWLNEGEWRGTRLLSEATVQEALTVPAARYGYGWYLRDAPGSDEMPAVFYHGGWDGTLAIALPAADAMVIYLTQSRGRAHRDALWNRLGRLEIFEHPGPYAVNLASAVGREVGEVFLGAEDRTPYVGSYRFEADGASQMARVWEQGGRLHFSIPTATGSEAAWLFHLVPLGEHRFKMGRYREDRLEAIDPTFHLRFTVEGGEAVGFDLMTGERTVLSASRER